MTIKAELSNINKTAQQLITLLGNKTIIAFYGEMGSGKTTIIKSLCDCLNCVDTVNSPTFSIINEYFTKDRKTVYHFDFYRLKNIREALDIGVEEYFFSGNYCFIEWPEIIESLLPDNCMAIHIEKGESHNIRILKVKSIES